MWPHAFWIQKKRAYLLCDFELGGIDQLGVEVNIAAVIADRPALFRPGESKRAVSVRVIRNRRCFVDDVIGRRDVGDVLRDPDRPDFGSERQITPLPTGINFRGVGGGLIGGGALRSRSEERR